MSEAQGPPIGAGQAIRSSSALARVRTALSDIKLAHSIFAMPFALLAVFLALPGATDTGELVAVLALVVVCMVLARTWAMLVNRLADARFDAQNPRTAGRAIPAGRMSRRDGLLVALGSAALFQGAAALFGVFFDNWWPAILAIPVLAWIAFYSFTKRFTALCHLFLGGALAASPVAAAIAVNPDALATAPSIWWLAGMVLLWVGGFDVIYALADLDFDRRRGLHSVPAALGWRGAAWVSRALHVGAFACLVAAWRADARLGAIFLAAVALVGALLVVEHVILARRGKAGLDVAFFTFNGVVSVIIGLLGSIDALL